MAISMKQFSMLYLTISYQFYRKLGLTLNVTGSKLQNRWFVTGGALFWPILNIHHTILCT